MPLFGEIVVIKRNGTDGTHFPLTATTCLFGRKSECDIRIQLPHVSKEHCRVEVKANKEVFVVNLSAVNPTQLNGTAIEQTERLKHGDVITIIDRSFRFEQSLTKPRSQSTGGNSLRSKFVEEESPSIKGKASKLTRKSEGNVSRTTHTRLSLPVSPNRRSSRGKKDLSPFGELYEMLKSKVDLKQEHAKTPAKQNMENGDNVTPTTTRRSLGTVKATPELSIGEFESQELHVESATLSEKTASALKSPSRGRQSPKQEQQRLSIKRDSPAKSNDKLTPRRSTSKEPAQERTPAKSGGSVIPRSRNLSPRSASPKDLHKNAKVSKPQQKRRSSELELPEPTPKRKRVSFGGHLSPELFDKRLPPNSPLKRGAAPARRSLSLATPLAVIRKSFGGFKQSAIKEAFEPGTDLALFKRSPAKATPAKRSPAKGSPAKATPAKRSPAKGSPAKLTPAKRSPAKGSPAKATPAKRSPAKGSPAKASPAKRSPAKVSPAKRSPAKASPAKRSPAKASPAKRSPAKASPAKRSPAKASPAKRSPAKASPAKRSPAKASPAKMSPAKASPAKMSPAKASPAKRSPAKASPAKRSPAKASPAKRSPAKASPAKRSPAKATPAKKSPAKGSPAKVTPSKRSPAKASPAKRSPAKGSPAKVTPAKRSPAKGFSAKVIPAKRSPAKASPAKRSPAKASPAKRSPAKVTPAKRSPAKGSPAKVTAAKRSPAKATPAKRSPAKATPAKRSPAKVTPAKRSPAKGSPAKVTPAKRSPAKVTPAKRSPAKVTPAKRSPAKVTPAKRSPAKVTPAKRSPAKGSPAKATPAKRSPAKATPAKRSPAKATPAKRSPAKATPAKRSPAKATPAKRSPAKATPAKRSPAKATPAKRSPAKATPAATPVKRSPATSYTKGRFSISRINTPPQIDEKNELSAQTPRKSRKSTSFKKTPGRRSRKLETFELLRSRRRSGATEANLLVAKSWADVVRIGVPKSQKKSEKDARKAVPTKRKPKPKTPARRVIDRTGTGHADSPATILVGRAHTRTVNLTGYIPKIVQNKAIKITDQNESFTGLSELFNTPDHVKPRKSGRSVKTPQSAIVDMSLMKTPEELGEMVVSPLNGSPAMTSKKPYSRDAVSRLLSPVSPASETSVDSELMEKEAATLNENQEEAKSQKKKRETMGLTGVKRIMRTPKQKGKPVIDPVAIKKMLRTPKQKESLPVEDMTGIQHIMKTPKVKGQPVEDMAGIARIMKTPRRKEQPVEDMIGIKRIMRTPKVKGQPVEDMVGIKRIMRTPKEKGQPVEDMEGLSQLMSTPSENTHPIEEIFGMKRLIKTPPKRTLGGREGTSGTPSHSAKKATLYVENNSTSAQETNLEEVAPMQVYATKDTSSKAADKATPAKRRGRLAKCSISESPASSNKDSDKSVEKNSTSALEKHLEESSEEAPLPLPSIASSTSADKGTPAKRRGRPSKRSLSHSPGLEKHAVDVSDSTSNSNIPEESSDIRKDQQKNVALPMVNSESEQSNKNLGAKKVTKKSQRKNMIIEETVQIAAEQPPQPLENVSVENGEKSAPQRRRRLQKGSSSIEVSDEVLPEELPISRRTGRGRKIAEVTKLQEVLEVSTSVGESQVEVRIEESTSTKNQSKSRRPQRAAPEDSTVTTTKKLRGRQPKVDSEQKAAEDENTVDKPLAELPGDSALVNNVTPSVRRGRRARGNANSVTETVEIEANLPDLTNHIVLHEEQESSSRTSPEAKPQRGRRQNLKSATVDSVKKTTETDAVTLGAGKRSTRAVRGTQQVEEPKEQKGKVDNLPKHAEPVLVEENLAKKKASKSKSVQWHPLLAVQETAENSEETVKNLEDALVSPTKSRGRRRQEVKEAVVPAKRSRSRKEENNADTVNSSSVKVDVISPALVASEGRRGRRQANIQLVKITVPDLPVEEDKNNESEVSSKQDLKPEIGKALTRRNTGKRNLKSSSDSDSGSNVIEPVFEAVTQKRGRRGVTAKISDSETTGVKIVESAENVTSSKRRGRAASQKTNKPEITNTATEPADNSPENVAVTEKIESPPKSKRGLKRKTTTSDVSEGNTSIIENGPLAPVRASTRGASRQKTAVKEKPVVAEESPAKKQKTEPSSSTAQKGGKTKTTAAKRQNEKPTEVVKTRQTLRSRK
ncbi:proliferation marker protein Ki-67 isoform X4 [Xenopus laevis]|uniref:Proliferation marker protein Ki-67 isoform X4 n=1 Tax=Xenopus laevis TaxID=8355 RepID=A0A8J1L4T0_XENLA|nr:proliferation marker protein Ki-67 isoform X4 [Xenopus laevis]